MRTCPTIILGLVGLSLLLAGCGEDPEASGADGGTCVPVTETIEAPDGATLGLLETCTPGRDDECLSGLCFNFNARGPKCTAPCTRDCECPAPSSGCSNRGVCMSH